MKKKVSEEINGIVIFCSVRSLFFNVANCSLLYFYVLGFVIFMEENRILDQ